MDKASQIKQPKPRGVEMFYTWWTQKVKGEYITDTAMENIIINMEELKSHVQP